VPNKKYNPSPAAITGGILFLLGAFILFTSTINMVGAKYKATVNPGTSSADFSYTFQVGRNSYTYSSIYPDVIRNQFYRLTRNPYSRYPAGSTIDVSVRFLSHRSRRYSSSNSHVVIGADILSGPDYVTSGIAIVLGLALLRWDNQRHPPTVESHSDSFI